jgi:hypothetical protein
MESIILRKITRMVLTGWEWWKRDSWRNERGPDFLPVRYEHEESWAGYSAFFAEGTFGIAFDPRTASVGRDATLTTDLGWVLAVDPL